MPKLAVLHAFSARGWKIAACTPEQVFTIAGVFGVGFLPTMPCALCQQDRELRESHIIPKFVFRWMRATNATGYLRRSGSPNLRQQDGVKQDLLCEDCEQKFSKAEGSFERTIFTPYLKNAQSAFAYDEQLFQFAASVLWRVLHRDLPRLPADERFGPHRDKLAEAEQEWRALLLHGQKPRRYHRLHIFLTDVGTKDGTQPVVNFNRYMARASDFTIAAGRRGCFVYAKFARFILFGEISGIDAPDANGTIIDPRGGVLHVPQAITEGSIGEFMADRAKTSYEMVATRLSPRQRQVIETALRSNPERVRLSDEGRVLEADRQALVTPVLPRKVGRNELCPCGSGTKFKRCHGR